MVSFFLFFLSSIRLLLTKPGSRSPHKLKTVWNCTEKNQPSETIKSLSLNQSKYPVFPVEQPVISMLTWISGVCLVPEPGVPSVDFFYERILFEQIPLSMQGESDFCFRTCLNVHWFCVFSHQQPDGDDCSTSFTLFNSNVCDLKHETCHVFFCFIFIPRRIIFLIFFSFCLCNVLALMCLNWDRKWSKVHNIRWQWVNGLMVKSTWMLCSLIHLIIFQNKVLYLLALMFIRLQFFSNVHTAEPHSCSLHFDWTWRHCFPPR